MYLTHKDNNAGDGQREGVGGGGVEGTKVGKLRNCVIVSTIKVERRRSWVEE